MHASPSRNLIGLAAAGALFLTACSSSDNAPDGLAMSDATETTVVDADVTTTVQGPMSFEDLTDDQRTTLDDCATAVRAVTDSFDESSETYESDVLAGVMAEDSTVFDVCGPLLEADSAVPADIVLAFMVQELPPALVTVLGGAIDPELMEEAGIAETEGDLPG